jgi:hypothetical protein
MRSLMVTLMLAAAVSAVLVPVFFGYGLAEGRGGPMLVSFAFLVLAAILFTGVARLRRGQPVLEDQSHHH